MVMHVADDGLGAWLNGDVLNADGLLPLAAHAGESLDLSGEGALKFDRHVAVELEMVRSVRRLRPAQHFHRERVAACHLDRERTFQFILRAYRFDDRKGGIHILDRLGAGFTTITRCQLQRAQVARHERA